MLLLLRIVNDDVGKTVPGDTADLVQRRIDLGRAIVAQPGREPGQNAGLLVFAGADDEREARNAPDRRRWPPENG